MSPLTTIYRTFVMVAAGIIIVKGWQLYGPPADRVREMAVRALAAAQEVLSKTAVPTESAANLAPHPGSSEVTGLPINPINGVVAPPLAMTTDAKLSPAPPAETTGSEVRGDLPVTNQHATEARPLPELLTRLEELGVSQPQLVPWGSGGLYRCSCRAGLNESPILTRHFEAVAAEPSVAVEQVAAKIRAWRTQHQLQTAQW
jgi:hypothetical protein